MVKNAPQVVPAVVVVGLYCKPPHIRVSFYITVFLVETYLLPLNFAFWGPVKIRDTADDSNHRNGRTIFAPLIFAFPYLPAKIAKIKGTRKFRGVQYLLRSCRTYFRQAWSTFSCHRNYSNFWIRLAIDFRLRNDLYIVSSGALNSTHSRLAIDFNNSSFTAWFYDN